MAKKRVRRKSPRRVSKVSRSISNSEKHERYARKMKLSLKNFVLFFVLAILSYIIFSVATQPIFVNLFEILAILFGFLSLALLITFFIFVLLKWFAKR
ncbi:MAG: hypothetical protein Q7S56_00035 [Nanoarchaeota archaeon]|nr:hypothetical protein [Nanoarchaeota archaeon]